VRSASGKAVSSHSEDRGKMPCPYEDKEPRCQLPLIEAVYYPTRFYYTDDEISIRPNEACDHFNRVMKGCIMATQTTEMTSSEFAKAAGLSAAGVSKLIREGKLKAKKEGGKWMIPKSQLGSEAVRALKGKAKAARGRQASKAAAEPSRPVSVPRAPIAAAPEAGRSAAAAATAPSAARETEVRPTEKTFSIPEFAAMTYLTEKGVAEWLKAGRIKGVLEENGEWRVLERNLQVADISRLLRK
jgi:hypothetical protein